MAVARSGITLLAVLPTSTVVKASVEGAEMLVALVELEARQAVDHARELGDRIVGLFRIGDMALRAGDGRH